MKLWREAGLPVFPSPESAVRAAVVLAEREEILRLRADEREAVG
jgi:acyl-CoA synthetase (NDP forming)